MMLLFDKNVVQTTEKYGAELIPGPTYQLGTGVEIMQPRVKKIIA